MRVVVRQDVLPRLHHLLHRRELLLQQPVDAHDDVGTQNADDGAPRVVVLRLQSDVQVVDRFSVLRHVLRVHLALHREVQQLVRQLAIRVAPAVYVMDDGYALRTEQLQVALQISKVAIGQIELCVSRHLRLAGGHLQLLADPSFGCL